MEEGENAFEKGGLRGAGLSLRSSSSKDSSLLTLI